MSGASVQVQGIPGESVYCSEILRLSSYQKQWESRSSVRTRPRKAIDFSKKGFFFPQEKQPVLLVPSIQKLGQAVGEEILLHSFYKYLHDITTLEVELIAQASLDVMADRVFPLIYPLALKRDILTILVDEFYHVYIAQDLIRQLEEQFPSIRHMTYPLSDAAQAVQHTLRKLDVQDHALFGLIAVCLFETTLVRELVEFFHSPNVHPSVQYYVNDHMNDEARHYHFFYELLQATWAVMPQDKRETMGSVLPCFLENYLNITSDIDFHRQLLGKWVKDKAEIEEMLQKLYKGFSVTPDIPIVKNVLNVLSKTGLMDTTCLREGLAEMGWIVP